LEKELGADARSGLTTGWQTMDTCPRGKNVILFAVTAIEDGVVKNWRMDSGFIRYGDDDPWLADVDGYTGIHWHGNWLKGYELMPTHWHPMPNEPEELKLK
jgi:hypothetical protein